MAKAKKKKKQSKSRFGGNVVADAERRQKAAANYGYLKLPKGITMFKESAGRLKFDIIPYIVTDKKHLDKVEDMPDTAHSGNPWYKRPLYVHRGIGAKNESVVCPRTIGKRCPICEYREKQFKEGEDSDSIIGKPQLRNVYVIIPKGHKDYEEKMHIWDISNGNFQSELDKELEENPDLGDFPDPENGRMINARFSEESFHNNKFYQASRVDFDDRDDQYEEDIMEEAPNLDEAFTILSYEDIEKVFLGLDDEDIESDEDEEEDDKKKAKKSSRKKKKREPEEDEDDEEEEDEDDEDDDEEEEDEDDEDDEDDDEEDDEDDDEEEEEPEPEPKKKSKSKKSKSTSKKK